MLAILCMLAAGAALAGPFSLSLNGRWQFREVGTGPWLPASVPGTVHTDLLRAGRIPDPFYRDNERKVQWISAKDWEYRTSFTLAEDALRAPDLNLIFEGLDTYADVWLNGEFVLRADNMFRTWNIDAKRRLLSGRNEILIRFYSAEKLADSLARAALPLVRPSENNRHYVRKAQYHFGWDWGPKLITAGIWRGVRLVGRGLPEKVPDPPGKANAYKVELVQDADSAGRSFYFRIDGRPVFMQGANWIPADVFLPRVTKAKYRKLLLAAKRANINMLRVWGGGIYEDDAFYDLCDSLGIMVWQDFMFAGAMYPGDAHFTENVRLEAIDNITRLRRHKCIVLWCGNNEIDEAWNAWGWQAQFHLTAADSAKLRADYDRLFGELLPQLVAEYDGIRPYIATSPAHGWGRPESMTEGDSHYWGVWWGGEPLETYRQKVPRFMSEYGMQAMPGWETIRQFSLPKDRDTASAVMKAHQKSPGGYQKLAAYLSQNGYRPAGFRAFAAATQDLQAKALATAITAHKSAAPYCMGTLFWQFNDCWPVSSWSVIDYYGRKKKGYFTVKRLYGKRAGSVPDGTLPLKR